MKRIFVAINLPERIREKLGNVQQEIVEMYPEKSGKSVAKWVKRGNLHITALFIGEADDAAILAVNEALKEVAKRHESIPIIFSRACYGPAGKFPPRLVWVEVEDNPMLHKLIEDIKSKMLEKNVLKRPDERPFQGHITIGRIREWEWKRINPEERPDIEQNIGLTFTATSVELMESHLKREGPEYSVIQSVPLIQKV